MCAEDHFKKISSEVVKGVTYGMPSNSWFGLCRRPIEYPIIKKKLLGEVHQVSLDAYFESADPTYYSVHARFMRSIKGVCFNPRKLYAPKHYFVI